MQSTKFKTPNTTLFWDTFDLVFCQQKSIAHGWGGCQGNPNPRPNPRLNMKRMPRKSGWKTLVPIFVLSILVLLKIASLLLLLLANTRSTISTYGTVIEETTRMHMMLTRVNKALVKPKSSSWWNGSKSSVIKGSLLAKKPCKAGSQTSLVAPSAHGIFSYSIAPSQDFTQSWSFNIGHSFLFLSSFWHTHKSSLISPSF